MGKMLICGVMMILLNSALSAQNVGDKVNVVLKNGNEFHAIIKGMDADMIYLDLSIEYKSSVDGTIGFQRNLIDKVETVKEFAEEKDKTSISETKARLEKENEDVAKRQDEVIAEDAARAEAAKKKAEEDKKAAQQKAQASDASKKMADLANELQLLKEFPPGDQWNESAYNALKDQFVNIKVPLTFEQQKFVDNYDTWKKAVQDSAQINSQQNSAPSGGNNATPPQNNTQGAIMYDPSALAYYPYLYPYYSMVAIIPPGCYHGGDECNICRNCGVRNSRFGRASIAAGTSHFACNY